MTRLARTLYALVFCAPAIAPPPLAAQERWQPHMEACIHLGITDGMLTTFNQCDAPVTVMIMTLDTQQVAQSDVAPGARFNSQLAMPPDANRPIMYSVCPVGFVPSAPFTFQSDAIMKSLYNCVPNGRPGV